MPLQNPPIPAARHCIDEADVEAVCHALKEPFITRGEQVSLFEKELAAACQAPFAVAFSSGSAALHAACLALNIGPGDRVFVPANTFVATASCGYATGAHLHFVDIDPSTGLMCAEHLAQLIGNLPPSRCFCFPVHFAGRCVDLRSLKRAFGKSEVAIIEDSSHAIGGSDFAGNRVGSCSDSALCTFSFHASKNMTTGEGGAVTARDAALAERLRLIRNSGIQRCTLGQGASPHPWLYRVQELSSNFHMTDFAAALGRSQLKKLDDFRAKKAAAVERYVKMLKNLNHLQIPSSTPDDRVHYHLFFVLIDFAAIGKSREDLMHFFKAQGIGTGVHYIPLYHHPCWQKKEKRGGCFTNTQKLRGSEEYYRKTLSLPLFSDIAHREIDTVCSKLQKWLLSSSL